ncbi:protein NEDD1 isoform X2 [Latimeria chalumnae]|uniref:protein NEDD1 isoform X2 n=1 Tax=Latimeria chalumnae TaxID=7897 RepID=UPI00313DF6B0
MQESLRFASSGDDIKIWDSSSLTVVEQFNPHAASQGVSSLCWSSNNHFLISASAAGDKVVVSSCKSKPVTILELADGKEQTCVNLNSNSQYLVTGGLDNTVNIWDLKSRRLYRSLKDHKDKVTSVSFNSNDCYIASGSESGEIILHSITTNFSSAPFGHGSSQPVRDLRYSLFKKSLLGCVSDSGTTTLWDVNTQTPYHAFENAHKAPSSGLCFSPVNELLFVTIGLDKRIICYDTSSKMLLRTVVAEHPLTAVEFMPDGAMIAVGSSRGRIYLYDLRMLTSPLKSIGAHKTSVKCLKCQSSTTQVKSSGFKASASKMPSSALAAASKRAATKTSNTTGGSQNAGIVREIPNKMAEAVPAPPQPLAVTEGSGPDASQDKTELPHSTSLDVIPSKENDLVKSADSTSYLKNFDSLGKSSWSDLLSPVRDGLDFLTQSNSSFSTRRNPVGASTQGSFNFSPLHIFGGSPQIIKEEEENPEQNVKIKAPYGKQEPKESLNQLVRFNSSSMESVSLGTPLSCSTEKTPETRGKDIQAQLLYDFPVNGTLEPNPRITSSVTAGVASSLSEKIAGSINGDGTSAPLTSVQIHFIKKMIEETLEDFREACHRDIVNLQLEMIKQFHLQLMEMHSLLERYSVNGTLVEELEKLREENKRLQTKF